MNISELYNRCQGHFVDVRLMEENEFIKTVFTSSRTVDHGHITRSFIYADIVPDGNEEAYLRTCAENPAALQKIPIIEGEIAELRVGNRVSI